MDTKDCHQTFSIEALVFYIQAKLFAILYFIQSDIAVSMGLQAKAEIKVQLLLVWRTLQAQHGTSSPSLSCDTRSDEEMCLHPLLTGTSLKGLINSHLSRIGLACVRQCKSTLEAVASNENNYSITQSKFSIGSMSLSSMIRQLRCIAKMRSFASTVAGWLLTRGVESFKCLNTATQVKRAGDEIFDDRC